MSWGLRTTARPPQGLAVVRQGRLWGPSLRSALGLLLGVLVRLWVKTLRIRVVGADSGAPEASRIFAFWHGQQMLLVGAPRTRRTAILVSWSRDGDLQSGVMRALGLLPVRGSASRGAAEGLRRVVALVHGGRDAAFAVDGSRGPLHQAKLGAARAASLGKGLLIPLGAAAARATVLRNTWDRFEIPRPFSRVVVVLGAPLPESVSSEELGAAIQIACTRAAQILEGRQFP